MCTVLLPPGGYPIAVISYHIKVLDLHIQSANWAGNIWWNVVGFVKCIAVPAGYQLLGNLLNRFCRLRRMVKCKYWMLYRLCSYSEVFPCFFLSCNANARVKLARWRGTVRTVPNLLLFVLFCCYLCCSMYCLCVNVYCTTATGWQPLLTNISYHIIYHTFKLIVPSCHRSLE